MKKIILTGIIGSIVMFVLGYALSWLTGIFFPQLMTEYTNTTIFRPWSDPKMSLFFISPLISGFIIAIIWDKVKTLFKYSSFKNGIILGLIYWGLSFPGMIISYSSFQISLLMVITWSVSILIQGICASFIYTFMNK